VLSARSLERSRSLLFDACPRRGRLRALRWHDQPQPISFLTMFLDKVEQLRLGRLDSAPIRGVIRLKSRLVASELWRPGSATAQSLEGHRRLQRVLYVALQAVHSSPLGRRNGTVSPCIFRSDAFSSQHLGGAINLWAIQGLRETEMEDALVCCVDR
jgi:hypothetical protein